MRYTVQSPSLRDWWLKITLARQGGISLNLYVPFTPLIAVSSLTRIFPSTQPFSNSLYLQIFIYLVYPRLSLLSSASSNGFDPNPKLSMHETLSFTRHSSTMLSDKWSWALLNPPLRELHWENRLILVSMTPKSHSPFLLRSLPV